MALRLDRMHDGRPSHRLTLTIDYGQVLRFVAAELLSSGRVLRIRGRLNSLRLIGLPRAQSRRGGAERLRAARHPCHTALSHIGVFFISVRTSSGRASPESDVSKGAERQFFCRSFPSVACLLRLVWHYLNMMSQGCQKLLKGVKIGTNFRRLYAADVLLFHPYSVGKFLLAESSRNPQRLDFLLCFSHGCISLFVQRYNFFDVFSNKTTPIPRFYTVFAHLVEIVGGKLHRRGKQIGHHPQFATDGIGYLFHTVTYDNPITVV